MEKKSKITNFFTSFFRNSYIITMKNNQYKSQKDKYQLITEKFICPKCKKEISVFTDYKIKIKKLHICKEELCKEKNY